MQMFSENNNIAISSVSQ